MCGSRVSVLLHPSLYRALRQTFPTAVGEIVLDGRIMSEIGTGAYWGTFPVRFPFSLRLKGVLLKNIYEVSQFECERLEGLE